MNKNLGALARILLAQLFLLQISMLIFGFFNNPTGYQEYQLSLGTHGLPGIFAPLIILVQGAGGVALLLGYKTRAVSIILAIYAVFISFALGLAPLQYLAIAGGLLSLAANPSSAFSLDNLKK